MISLKEITYVETIPKNIHLVLAADIGGTNSNFGVCAIQDNTVSLFISVHTLSKDITNFPDVVHEVLDYFQTYHDISLKNACFAAAGVVSEDRTFCKPTNLDFNINVSDILAKTTLETAHVINDFEAVGWGVDFIAKKDLVTINQGKPREKANRAIIGAGTGLGKGILGWDHHLHGYLPVPSEGGHADFPIYNDEEYLLMKFIKDEIDHTYPVSWENVLNGAGIMRIYNFLGIGEHSIPSQVADVFAQQGLQPDQIFKNKDKDTRCAAVFEKYRTFYARCAKNFALEALSLGGMFIAGGIAAKNLDLFQHPDFLKEFTRCKKQQDVLQNIPICVIKDYNVSLFGAAAFLAFSRQFTS